MISPEEIRSVSFERNMRGYRCDDVDDFLQQVAQDMEDLAGQIAMLKKQKEESDQKLYILAQKIEEYRGEEDTLKTALLNAQRMGENVIREAKQKAESILRDANIKADDITHDAREQVEEYTAELERVQAEVAHFKASVLGLYKQHIESLSTLPGEEPEEELPQEKPLPVPQEEAKPEEPMMPQASPAASIAEDILADKPLVEPILQAAPQTAAPAQQEDLASAVDAWRVSAEQAPAAATNVAVGDVLTAEFPAQAQPSAPEAPAMPQTEAAALPDGFQGIRFSD